MSTTLPSCPQCSCEWTYEDGALLVCPECGHEWAPSADAGEVEAERVVRDAVGNVLVDGDDVVVVTSLKVKGSAQPLKAGTKVRGIRLVDGHDGHDISCRIEGFGAMELKSSVVRKA